MNGREKFIKTIQIVILISIIEMFTQVSLKTGTTLEKGERYLFYGMIGYALISCLLWKNFTFDGMGQVNLLWSCISIVTAFIAGFFLFKEPINKYTGYSIMFALIAVYFSYLSDVKNEV